MSMPDPSASLALYAEGVARSHQKGAEPWARTGRSGCGFLDASRFHNLGDRRAVLGQANGLAARREQKRRAAVGICARSPQGAIVPRHSHPSMHPDGTPALGRVVVERADAVELIARALLGQARGMADEASEGVAALAEAIMADRQGLIHTLQRRTRVMPAGGAPSMAKDLLRRESTCPATFVAGALAGYALGIATERRSAHPDGDCPSGRNIPDKQRLVEGRRT